MSDMRDASSSGAAPATADAAEGPVPGTAEAGGLPRGRYGRSGGGGAGGADARADRKLKIIGGVLGVAFLALLGWLGGSYIAGQDVSGELIKFKIVSDGEVQVHLEVRKDAGTAGVCTLRTRSEDGGEVGRKDVPIAAAGDRVDTVAAVRTTSRATSAELIGCQPASGD